MFTSSNHWVCKSTPKGILDEPEEHRCSHPTDQTERNPSLPLLPLLNKIIQKTATLTQLPFCWLWEALFTAGDLLSFWFCYRGSTFPAEWQGNTQNKKRLVGGLNIEKQREIPFPFVPNFYLYPPPNTNILTPPAPGEMNLPYTFGF